MKKSTYRVALSEMIILDLQTILKMDVVKDYDKKFQIIDEFEMTNKGHCLNQIVSKYYPHD